MGENNFKVKVPLTGFFGIGTGVSVGTVAAEFTSRATGQTGWYAAGVKGLVKGLVGGIGYGISTRITDPGKALASFFAEMFAYGVWGSWFIDIALALYPGGFAGLAEDWASSVRVYAAGGRKVVRELATLERKDLKVENQIKPKEGWF